ncbi:protein smoothened [Copidosoma floridanum]|uniref:protein smoothened n=1 Tax=Copidosoma floridanum TaxID=29053 RepID=UPI0006C960A3|nr:protein smoothened [Copidosoma floridanum]
MWRREPWSSPRKTTKMILLLYFATLVPFARPELDHGFGANNNRDDESWTETSVQHRIMEPAYLLPRLPLSEFPGDYFHCRRPAKCVHMSNSTCMGTRLPYDTTSMDLIPYYTTQEAIREKLYLLQSLKHIPKCWAVVQPFLCSVFMPKCINDTVDLPSQEMCRIVSGPCRIIFNHTIWPSFIKCEDTKLFPKLCKNDIREVKFNTSGKCLDPLIHTDNQLAIFEGVEGCGMPCNDPLYTQDEKIQIHSFISWAAGLCCFFNFFTVVTFLIDWRSANKYPALVIFYINCCFMVSCIGWLLQFTRGSREVIVCRKDNTLRMSEPSGENLSCVVVFVLVYYSIMAAMVWFVVLTYTWHMTFQALGKIQDRIDKKGAYFHLLAWCLPLMLTVTVMALGEIDGNYVTGICFVGYNNHVVRAWFVLGPVSVVVLIGGYFLSRSLITLIRLKISSQEVISERVSSKIRETIVRMGLFSVFIFVTVIITFYCHIYEFKHTWEWKQSFRDYMMCSITSKYADTSECKITYRPSAGKLQLHLLAPFFAGILMSSWVWTSSTIDTWIRFFKRIFNSEPEEPVKLKKHKVIAQAFAKRKMFNSAGRLSITFHNTHEDPVGLNFDLNSVASQDFSSTWAAALPKLVTRRGALVGGSMSSNRRNSTDSQYSFSLRRVSVESRRNSCDSQFALSFSEMKADFKTSRVKNSNKRRKKPPERSRKRSESYKRGTRRDYEKCRSRPNKMISPHRRGSTTSQESQLGVQILSALSIGAASNTAPVQGPNMKRRPGLDEGTLALKDAERLLPFLFTQQTDSDEDLSSEEKPNGIIDKDIDLEVGNEKNNQESDNEDSQAEEETKMLETKDICEGSKSKISNKSFNRNDRRISTDCQAKYLLEDEKSLKHLLKDSNDCKIKNENNERDKKFKESTLSYSPDLTRLIQHDVQSNAREMATQTLPLKMLEMEALNQSIDEIINSRSCNSRGTQIPPLMKKSKKQPK